MKETVNFNVELQNLSTINPAISCYKCFIMYPDEPANKFIFSKSVLFQMRFSVMGAPILTYYSKEDKKFLGHEDDLVGNKRTPPLTGIGFCDYLDEPYFEMYKEKEFLTCKTYLWSKRFPELKNLKNVAQSAEVELDYTTDKNGMKIVTSAEVTGLALIGITPAFKDAGFVSFSKKDFTQEIETLKQEFEQTKVKPSEKLKITNINQINTNNNTLEGGENENMHGLTAKQLERRLISGFKDFKYIDGTYQYQRYHIDDYDENSVIVHDNQDKKIYRFQYIFKDDACQIDMSTKIQMENDYKPASFTQKVEFSVGEKLGKSSAIDIKNDKENSAAGEWSDPGASLLNDLLEASNHESLVKEAYLVINGDASGDLSINNVHYPHHVKKDDNLVIHFRGVQAALSRARAQGLTGEPINHLKRHYKELGLNMDNFSEFGLSKEDFNYLFADKKNTVKEGENMTDFKALYSQMKASGSKFSLDDSDEDILIFIDGDAQCIYILVDGIVSMIPYETDDALEGDTGFAIDESAKKVMPNGKEMMMSIAKMASSKNTEMETQKTEMSAQLSAKETEMSEALLSKDAEIGKNFAAITSMETAMAEQKAVMAERDAQIAELSKQLQGKETAEKMSQVEEFLNGKEFSVFSVEEKQAFKDKAIEMSLDSFKDMTYSVFGKKIKDKIDFSANTQKFSFMYVENDKYLNTQVEKDVYADIRKKNNK